MVLHHFGATVAFVTAIVCSSLTPLAYADEHVSSQTSKPSPETIQTSTIASPANTVGPVEDGTAEALLSVDLPLASNKNKAAASSLDALKAEYEAAEQNKAQALAEQALREQREKLLAYDPALIAAIGNQLNGGHTICCPGYACAYGDAILLGEAIDHSAYGCGTCTWPNWGGGNSSFRSLGSNEALLREAYDQIAAGKPTVIHVSGPYGEHWITLMGYHGVDDPDNLTLANFTALDPADGNEIDPSGK
ncbi:MAG: hypothetical protein RR672_12325, partial [Raoultibacter sp.]